MAFTNSAGLRDREYAKFKTQTSHPGSLTMMVVDNPIKRYEFPAGSLVANAGGEFGAYTEESLNGMLQCVAIDENNFAGTAGSLFIKASGLETTIWSMISGTARGLGVATSGVTFPRATTVYTWASPISGASTDKVLAEIPLSDTVLHLYGSGLGAAKSGLGLTVVYR